MEDLEEKINAWLEEKTKLARMTEKEKMGVVPSQDMPVHAGCEFTSLAGAGKNAGCRW